MLLFYILKIIMKGGEYNMAVVYATLIIEGTKTFADVPKFFRNQVKQVLVDLGAEELAVE